MKDKFDLIVFDWDGTLIDSIDWIVQCIQYAAKTCQCQPPTQQESKDLIGLSLRGLMEALFPDENETKIRQLIACYSDRYMTWEIKREDLFNGVYDTLQALHNSGYQLAIATGKTRSGLNSALQGTDIGHFFSSTRCADETASKPNPLMLHEIIAQLQVSQTRTLMIGDSVHDLKMAANAQITSIAVTCGVHSEHILAPYKPLHCLPQTTELLNFL